MGTEIIKLLAKAEALQQEVFELKNKAMQYRQQAEKLMNNLPSDKNNEIRCINCIYSKLGFMECWCTYGEKTLLCPNADKCENFIKR